MQSLCGHRTRTTCLHNEPHDRSRQRAGVPHSQSPFTLHHPLTVSLPTAPPQAPSARTPARVVPAKGAHISARTSVRAKPYTSLSTPHLPSVSAHTHRISIPNPSAPHPLPATYTTLSTCRNLLHPTHTNTVSAHHITLHTHTLSTHLFSASTISKVNSHLNTTAKSFIVVNIITCSPISHFNLNIPYTPTTPPEGGNA